MPDKALKECGRSQQRRAKHPSISSGDCEYDEIGRRERPKLQISAASMIDDDSERETADGEEWLRRESLRGEERRGEAREGRF
ncbi:hypothetical protein RHGRI_031358 [Rhododendron griersonianum]|uniref:Uncharacterized protein n=1 Tax=Rhododendron griersonianum TaxID=479676 RepID=A0AAV6IAR4_9ERIC|nr:hypothetical protein RHGRI_031358 [Rhododendron griersonianum]